MKKQGQPWSVSLVTSKKNQWLLPPSSVPRYPTGSLPCCPQLSSQSSPLTLSLGIPLCPSPSCSPTSGSPAPFRACTTAPCQGNGVLNCLPPSSSSSSSLVSGKAEGRFGQQTPQNPPARLDETCVAARIRPVRTRWRRQLVRAASGSHCSRRPLRPLPVRCSCEWPSSCILCSCRVSLQTLDPNTMSLAERIALLDSGFHPLLSLSQGSLCEGRGQPKGASSHSFPVPSPQAHKYGPLHHPLFLYPETPPLPASQTPSTASSALSSKRRKAGCSYDIDNMVIPMSITAVAQVEKPQYKEIVVPSWRIAELKDLRPYNQVDSELEDTSDEMYSSHHSKHEDLERAHCDSWAAATSQRQGSRSHRRSPPTKQRVDGPASLSQHLQLLDLIAWMICTCSLLLACTALRLAAVCGHALPMVGPGGAALQ